MDDLTVLEDRITRGGVRRLRLMRVGRAIERDEVIGRCPAQSRGSFGFLAWEKGTRVKRYYAEVWWDARGEVLRVSPPSGGEEVEGVIWKLGKGERIREGVQDAADTFWGWFDRHPRFAYVRRLPKGAPERWRLEGVAQGAVEVRLLTAKWVPKGSVVVV